MQINTQLVAHEVAITQWGAEVVVHILSGHDEAHEVVIDRPAAAEALIAAANAYLQANA